MKLKPIAGLIISLFLSSEVLAAKSGDPNPIISSNSAPVGGTTALTLDSNNNKYGHLGVATQPDSTTTVTDNGRTGTSPKSPNGRTGTNVGFDPDSNPDSSDGGGADKLWGQTITSPELLATLRKFMQDGLIDDSLIDPKTYRVLENRLETGVLSNNGAADMLGIIESGYGRSKLALLTPEQGAVVADFVDKFTDSEVVSQHKQAIFESQLRVLGALLEDANIETPKNEKELAAAVSDMQKSGLLKMTSDVGEAYIGLAKSLETYNATLGHVVKTAPLAIDQALQNPNLSQDVITYLKNAHEAEEYLAKYASNENTSKGVDINKPPEMNSEQTELFNEWEEFSKSINSMLKNRVDIEVTQTKESGLYVDLVNSTYTTLEKYRAEVEAIVQGKATRSQRNDVNIADITSVLKTTSAEIETAVNQISQITTTNMQEKAASVDSIAELNELDMKETSYVTPAQLENIFTGSTADEINALNRKVLGRLSGPQLLSIIGKINEAAPTKLPSLSTKQQQSISVALSELTPEKITTLSTVTLKALTGEQLVTIAGELSSEQKSALLSPEILETIAERTYSQFLGSGGYGAMDADEKTTFKDLYTSFAKARYKAMFGEAVDWKNLATLANTEKTGFKDFPEKSGASKALKSLSDIAKATLETIASELQKMPAAEVATNLKALAELPEADRTALLGDTDFLTDIAVNGVDLTAVDPSAMGTLFTSEVMKAIIEKSSSAELMSFYKGLPAAQKTLISEQLPEIISSEAEKYKAIIAAAGLEAPLAAAAEDSFTAALNIEYSTSSDIAWSELVKGTMPVALLSDMKGYDELENVIKNAKAKIAHQLDAMSDTELVDNLTALANSPENVREAVLNDADGPGIKLLTDIAIKGVDLTSVAASSIDTLYTPEVIESIVKGASAAELAKISSTFLEKLSPETLKSVFNDLSSAQKTEFQETIINTEVDAMTDTLAPTQLDPIETANLVDIYKAALKLTYSTSDEINWQDLGSLSTLLKNEPTIESAITTANDTVINQLNTMTDEDLVANLKTLAGASKASRQQVLADAKGPGMKLLTDIALNGIDLEDIDSSVLDTLYTPEVMDNIIKNASAEQIINLKPDLLAIMPEKTLTSIYNSLSSGQKADIRKKIPAIVVAMYDETAEGFDLSAMTEEHQKEFAVAYKIALNIRENAAVERVISWDKLAVLSASLETLEKAYPDTTNPAGSAVSDLGRASGNTEGIVATELSKMSPELLTANLNALSNTTQNERDSLFGDATSIGSKLLGDLALNGADLSSVDAGIMDSVFTPDAIVSLLKAATPEQLTNFSPALIEKVPAETLLATLRELSPEAASALHNNYEANVITYESAEYTRTIDALVADDGVTADNGARAKSYYTAALELAFGDSNKIAWDKLAELSTELEGNSEAYKEANGLAANAKARVSEQLGSMTDAELVDNLTALAALPEDERTSLLSSTDGSAIKLLTEIAIKGVDVSSVTPSDIDTLYTPERLDSILQHASPEDIAKIPATLLEKVPAATLGSVYKQLSAAQKAALADKLPEIIAYDSTQYAAAVDAAVTDRTIGAVVKSIYADALALEYSTSDTINWKELANISAQEMSTKSGVYTELGDAVSSAKAAIAERVSSMSDEDLVDSLKALAAETPSIRQYALKDPDGPGIKLLLKAEIDGVDSDAAVMDALYTAPVLEDMIKAAQASDELAELSTDFLLKLPANTLETVYHELSPGTQKQLADKIITAKTADYASAVDAAVKHGTMEESSGADVKQMYADALALEYSTSDIIDWKELANISAQEMSTKSSLDTELGDAVSSAKDAIAERVSSMSDEDLVDSLNALAAETPAIRQDALKDPNGPGMKFLSEVALHDVDLSSVTPEEIGTLYTPEVIDAMLKGETPADIETFSPKLLAKLPAETLHSLYTSLSREQKVAILDALPKVVDVEYQAAAEGFDFTGMPEAEQTKFAEAYKSSMMIRESLDVTETTIDWRKIVSLTTNLAELIKTLPGSEKGSNTTVSDLETSVDTTKALIANAIKKMTQADLLENLTNLAALPEDERTALLADVGGKASLTSEIVSEAAATFNTNELAGTPDDVVQLFSPEDIQAMFSPPRTSVGAVQEIEADLLKKLSVKQLASIWDKLTHDQQRGTITESEIPNLAKAVYERDVAAHQRNVSGDTTAGKELYSTLFESALEVSYKARFYSNIDFFTLAKLESSIDEYTKDPYLVATIINARAAALATLSKMLPKKLITMLEDIAKMTPDERAAIFKEADSVGNKLLDALVAKAGTNTLEGLSSAAFELFSGDQVQTLLSKGNLSEAQKKAITPEQIAGMVENLKNLELPDSSGFDYGTAGMLDEFKAMQATLTGEGAGDDALLISRAITLGENLQGMVSVTPSAETSSKSFFSRMLSTLSKMLSGAVDTHINIPESERGALLHEIVELKSEVIRTQQVAAADNANKVEQVSQVEVHALAAEAAATDDAAAQNWDALLQSGAKAVEASSAAMDGVSTDDLIAGTKINDAILDLEKRATTISDAYKAYVVAENMPDGSADQKTAKAEALTKVRITLEHNSEAFETDANALATETGNAEFSDAASAAAQGVAQSDAVVEADQIAADAAAATDGSAGGDALKKIAANAQEDEAKANTNDVEKLSEDVGLLLQKEIAEFATDVMNSPNVSDDSALFKEAATLSQTVQGVVDANSGKTTADILKSLSSLEGQFKTMADAAGKTDTALAPETEALGAAAGTEAARATAGATQDKGPAAGSTSSGGAGEPGAGAWNTVTDNPGGDPIEVIPDPAPDE